MSAPSAARKLTAEELTVEHWVAKHPDVDHATLQLFRRVQFFSGEGLRGGDSATAAYFRTTDRTIRKRFAVLVAIGAVTREARRYSIDKRRTNVYRAGTQVPTVVPLRVQVRTRERAYARARAHANTKISPTGLPATGSNPLVLNPYEEDSSSAPEEESSSPSLLNSKTCELHDDDMQLSTTADMGLGAGGIQQGVAVVLSPVPELE